LTPIDDEKVYFGFKKVPKKLIEYEILKKN
jgi:hypothetical protein